MSSARLHIVYATDAGYLLPTYVSAASALAWASRPEDLVFHVLDGGVSDEAWNHFADDLRRRFSSEFGLERHAIDLSAYAQMKIWHESRGIYARLEIPQILDAVDWCVYADGDTLFTADPFQLEPLWDPAYALMGHLDAFKPFQAQWHLEHGLPWHDETHVCAGFMLMNLDWFRRQNATRRCFDLLAEHPDFPYNEQDALNIVCENYIKLLPDEWGQLVITFPSVERAGCLHYAAYPPWRFSLRAGIPLDSYKQAWIRAASVLTGRTPWQVLGCSRLKYALACSKTALMRVVCASLRWGLNTIVRRPSDVHRTRFWSRRQLHAVLPPQLVQK